VKRRDSYAGGFLCVAVQGDRDGIEVGQSYVRGVCQGATFVGQSHASGMSLEQLHAQGSLQPADVVADRTPVRPSSSAAFAKFWCRAATANTPNAGRAVGRRVIARPERLGAGSLRGGGRGLQGAGSLRGGGRGLHGTGSLGPGSETQARFVADRNPTLLLRPSKYGQLRFRFLTHK
jgi:hypothetical protein